MKKLSLLLVAVFICGFFSVNAQNIKPEKFCGTDELLEQEKLSDTTIESRMQALEVSTQEWIKNNQDYLENSKTAITIPVVVHIIYQNASQNIPDSRVDEQITAFNRNYAGLNPHSMGSFPANLKVNTNIQFCLAKRDPNGKATTGITRRTGTGVPASFNLGQDMKHQTTGGIDQWDPTKYLNIWVCYLSGYAGVGEFPYTSTSLVPNYGLVIKYYYFGITNTTSPRTEGGCATHEIGHCFNLRHIWGAGAATTCATKTDTCADTPTQFAATTGSPTGVVTDACSTTSPGIMYMNFMDYTDDVRFANFTPDQKARMLALFAPGKPLYPLTTSNGCTPIPSVEENDYIQNINIYPNPTNGELNIKFNIANPCDVSVSIYNILGEEIYSFNKNKTSIVNTNVDISNQAAGIYFVKIKTEKQILTQKISLLK